MNDKIEDKYLGDGVYASFDGYQIWLAANDHRNKVVAIEPQVWVALQKFVASINETYRVEYFEFEAGK